MLTAASNLINLGQSLIFQDTCFIFLLNTNVFSHKNSLNLNEQTSLEEIRQGDFLNINSCTSDLLNGILESLGEILVYFDFFF